MIVRNLSDRAVFSELRLPLPIAEILTTPTMPLTVLVILRRPRPAAWPPPVEVLQAPRPAIGGEVKSL